MAESQRHYLTPVARYANSHIRKPNLTEVLLDLENLINFSSIGHCNGDSQLFVQLPNLMASH